MKRTVKINPDKIIGTPNPKMWGVFYEEINHAGDGGIYAELIRNRSFADSRLPEACVYAEQKAWTKLGFSVPFDNTDVLPGWKLRLGEEAEAKMELTVENPRNPECAEQLKLTVKKADGGVRICNEGFWGIPLRRQAYYGFCILRGEGITEVQVGLMYNSGVVCCTQTLEVSGEFSKEMFELECPAEHENARFFVEVKQEGTLYLDFVTLFPDDTDQHRPYGFRKDLMDMLRDLKPGFVRFPGGCVVEGFNLQNAIYWKKTRGPIEDRPGHWDLWGYRATDGMGMLEFCQLAEDLNADLMYVANCGMSCQGRISELADEEGVEFWLQNALDAIEYISGEVDTPYGALRAQDGHPEPFALKYVEIGNENNGSDYHVRYRRFYAEIKKKYPELILIANEMVPDAPMDMVDDHYYTKPEVFPGMHHSYEEDGVPVYIGEYACNQEVGYGNLKGAISDATIMIRMENRADRIRIASYAPLFCNDNNREWPVNLINFDQTHVFGIPSYEIQSLFSNWHVEQVCDAECPIVEHAASNLHVTAGLRGKSMLIVKAANYGTKEIEAEFAVDKKQWEVFRALIVASEKETDTNSLLFPHYVKTAETAVEYEADRVKLTMPPYSFAVLVGEMK